MLIGKGVLVGKPAKVGSTETEVGGNWNEELVASGVSGSVVGTPLVTIGVRVGGDVFVGAWVSDNCCSGALVRLQALRKSIISNMPIWIILGLPMEAMNVPR